MNSTSSTDLNAMAANPLRLSYFSLPGEIRNKIMNYVLVPGDVYPYRPVPETTSTDKPETTLNVASRPGVNLLATCKQAYQEGHAMFYSFNTFHLPPTGTFSWSDRLLAKHKALIKRISITIGLVELTPAMLTEVENRIPARRGDKDGFQWAAAVGDVLMASRCSKVQYIAHWDSLEEFELRSFGRTYLLQHRELVAVWKGSIFQLYWFPCWKDILQRSYFYEYANIATKVTLEGWEVTKAWLGERKPGEMADKFLNGAGD